MTCAMTTGLLAGTASSASASTIQNQWVQLCAQGNYAAYVEFPYRGYSSSFVVGPGECQWWNRPSIGTWEPINVVDAWTGKVVGTTWYKGDVSGVGIGAEGWEGGSQWIQTW
ncbi:hypothetical protein FNH09_16230 [Streptomyces adustus]|uniref:Streptomyces killer toxin-like beta/gamma crystallin domain-containing protein n=1 Tax=Streptomyces adustus TaxID=1609272 RepID=A0A5N8VDM8_9ACTN|nr:hypothetical protein [Streptomyces adustus]MPY32762.1 hypothetical protein [Streptomyces adustus]